MFRACLLFFFCGVLIGLPVIILKLTSAYFNKWRDNNRRKEGYTREEWKNRSPEIPYIPDLRLATIISCILAIFTSIGLVVLLTVYLGPMLINAIALSELVYQILEDPNARELLSWKGGTLLLIGSFFSRFVIEPFAANVIDGIEKSIEADDDSAIPKSTPDASK